MDKTPSKPEGKPTREGGSSKKAPRDPSSLSGSKRADSKEGGLAGSKKRSADKDTPKKTVSKRVIKTDHCDRDSTGTLYFPTGEEAVPHIPEISWASLAWDVAKSLGSALSGDLFSSGISVPCNMYEPLSILQRSIEFLEFTSSLDQAATMKSAATRLAYVAGFALSPLPIAENRWRLDFNPILGETFEYVDTRAKSPVRCFTEQVSHHPPVTAVHAENDNFVFYQNYNAVTNFLGNSLEVNTNSKSYVVLKETKEKFLIVAPKIRVHNLIMGTMWMEYFGDLEVTNLTTGASLVLEFGKTGWLAGGPNYEVTGTLKEKDGKKPLKVKGSWDTFLTATYLVDTEDGKKGETFTVWKRDKLNFAGKQFQMTPFAWSCNSFPKALQQFVLPSDSRRRPDRIALAMGETDNATAWKRVAEGQQRTEQKARRGDKKEDPWVPVWFHLEKDHEDLPFFTYGGKYWELRKEQEELGEKGTPIFVDTIKNTAADFFHYRENFDQVFTQIAGAKGKTGIAVDR